MDHKLAIIDLRAGGAGADTAMKPLMLQPMLFCPVVRWVCQELLACGFVVCEENWRNEAAEALHDISGVSFYDRLEEALSAAEGDVIVVPGAVVPVWGEGNRAVYTADAALLRTRLAEGLTLGDCPAEAEGVRQLWQSPSIAPSFLPVADAAALQAAMPDARELLMKRMALNGVTVVDPNNTYVDPRCAVAPGVTLLPGTILRGHTVIGKGCEIGPNSMIRDCVVGEYTTVNASQVYGSHLGPHNNIGPFTHVRINTVTGYGVHLGAYVETKNSSFARGNTVSHLTYIGDSDVGKYCNFGCGTVTCNYDGKDKFRTTIGDYCFIGCNTNLVAPVTIGDGAYTAAGSTITKDVPPQALGIARERQTNLDGWAEPKMEAYIAKKQKLEQEQG